MAQYSAFKMLTFSTIICATRYVATIVLDGVGAKQEKYKTKIVVEWAIVGCDVTVG